jgi:hypothetical protein
MYKYLISLLFVTALLSCNREEKKQYRLTDEQLANLMFDLQLSEVVLPSVGPAEQDTLKSILNRQMFSIYNLTPEEIQNEVMLLESDPKKLKEIMDRVKIKADSIQIQ